MHETKQEGFSNRLNILMTEKGMTIREAAKIAGVSKSTIMSWRAGSNPIDYRAVRKLAKVLRTSLSYLLTGEVDSPPQLHELFTAKGEFIEGIYEVRIRKLVYKNSNNQLE